MSKTFLAAAAQVAPAFLNLNASIEIACEWIAKAGKEGVKVLVFPETWLPGYPVWLDYAPNAALWDHPPAKALYQTLVKNSVSIPGPHLEGLLRAARDAGAYVIIGAHERLGGTLYNTMIYLGRDGQRFQVHRKLMPSTPSGWSGGAEMGVR